MNYINAINNLRGTMGGNPEHNRHVQQLAQCIQDAFYASNLQYDMEMEEIRQKQKEQDERLDRMEIFLQAIDKKNSPTTPIPAEVYITQKSLNKLKNDIARHLN
ncbi:MAG: hypothetical protein IJE17_10490 [Clostridia bacterium]|nr:hypothetical protein [Clostridia bacterium]